MQAVQVLANYSASIRKKIDSARSLHSETQRRGRLRGGFGDRRVNEFK